MVRRRGFLPTVVSALASCVLAGCAGASSVPRLGESAPPWPGGPVLVPQVGHAGWVTAIAWAPDGRTVVSGGNDGRLIVWDAESGAVRASFRAVAGQGLSAVALSADGALLATAGGANFTGTDDPSVRVWEASTGRLLHTLVAHRRSVYALAFAPDGRLATAGADGRTCVFDALRGAELGCGGPRHVGGFMHWLKGDTRWATAVAFTDDDGLAVAYAGDDVELYDARSLSSRRFVARDAPFMGKLKAIGFAAHAPVSARLVGSSVEIASLADPTLSPRTSVPGDCDVVALSPDGKRLALVGDALRLVDAERGSVLHTLALGRGGIGAAAWSADGKRLAATTAKGLTLVDAATGAVLRHLAQPVAGDRQVAFSDDGRFVRTSSGAWDLSNGTYRSEAPPVGLFPAAPFIYASTIDDVAAKDATFIPGRSRLHTSTRHVALLDEAWQPVGLFTDLDDYAGDAVASPDGRVIAAGDAEGATYLFDAQTKKRLWKTSGQDGFVWGLAFSRDGALLAAADAQGAIVVRDAATGAEKKRYHLPGVVGAVRLAFSPDARFLAAASSSLRVFRLADDAELVLQALPLEGRPAALAISESGLFAGDDRAFSKVLFRAGPDLRTAELLSADQLFEQFHRPSLVADFFAGLAVAPSPEAKAAASSGAPGVELVEELPSEVTGERVRVRVRGVDRGAGVSELRVFANGARVGGWPASQAQGGAVEGGERGLKVKAVADVEVVLSPGDNVISAEAYSVKGRLRSARLERVVRAKLEAPARPHLWVVSIALDDYADPAQPLAYAKADGAALVGAFQGQKGRLYGDVTVTSLVDKAATREAFEAALADVAKRARPSDVLVLYAAGHGTMVACPGDAEARYHLLTYRASLRADPTICQHGISEQRLAELVRTVPARKKLVVLDTCQAGAAASERTLVAMRGAVEIDAIKRLARAEGVAIVAAAKAAEYAGEVPALGHGIFTYALLEGLSGKAAAGPGAVSVFGLLGYLQSEVPALSEKHLGRPQFPITSLQGQDFPLSLGR